MNKIKRGDDVIVTTGRDSGKRGTVLRLVSDTQVVIAHDVKAATGDTAEIADTRHRHVH